VSSLEREQKRVPLHNFIIAHEAGHAMAIPGDYDHSDTHQTIMMNPYPEMVTHVIPSAYGDDEISTLRLK
jgi:hypothetical protein